MGEGNFGGPKSSDKVIPLIHHPEREPDVVNEYVTSVDQVFYIENLVNIDTMDSAYKDHLEASKPK